MSESWQTFAFQLRYLLTHITRLDVLDMLLVAISFFVAFQALHQTRSLQMLRGAIILVILGGAILLLLPLTTFGWMVRVLLVAGLVALPLLFQDELRRALTGLGRFGRRPGYGSNFERFKNTLVTVTKKLASRHEGALIVLEGQTPLDDYISTGIPLHAEVLTAELLLTIFFPKTPLHDGAVILRGDRLMAAACILPVETEHTGSTHLGTRHRAALGLSQQARDALTIIVSEETSRISVAQAGDIYMGLTFESLDGWLDRFRDQVNGPPISQFRWLMGGGLGSSLVNFLLAGVLAASAWISLKYQANPPEIANYKNVPLTAVGQPADVVLTSQVPGTVRVQVQAARDQISQIDESSLRAEVNLNGLPPDIHRVNVQITLPDERIQLLSVTPAFVDVTLEPKITRTLTPTITILDADSLPLGYSLGQVTLTPGTLDVQGPQSLVERVAAVRLELSLNGRRSDFQQNVPVVLVDETGQVVEGLFPASSNILAMVPIRRTFYTREVAVQANLVLSSLPKDYQVTEIRIEPVELTLMGLPTDLTSIEDFISTVPITLTGVYSSLHTTVPLLLPSNLSALDEQGRAVTFAAVTVQVEPVTDYWVLSLKPVLRGLAADQFGLLVPNQVSILVTGPQPILAQIRQDPSLVAAYIDVSGLAPGVYELAVQVEAPEGVNLEVFPSVVQVILRSPNQVP